MQQFIICAVAFDVDDVVLTSWPGMPSFLLDEMHVCCVCPGFFLLVDVSFNNPGDTFWQNKPKVDDSSKQTDETSGLNESSTNLKSSFVVKHVLHVCLIGRQSFQCSFILYIIPKPPQKCLKIFKDEKMNLPFVLVVRFISFTLTEWCSFDPRFKTDVKMKSVFTLTRLVGSFLAWRQKSNHTWTIKKAIWAAHTSTCMYVTVN